MGRVYDLEIHRRRRLARSLFEPWASRFGETFSASTTFRDISDRTLLRLVENAKETNALCEKLVLGTLSEGETRAFGSLSPTAKIAVIDVALFLVDQLRFECMRRMGWIDDYPAFGVPILDVVLDFDDRFRRSQNETPALTVGHPLRPIYEQTFPSDRGTFVRRLIPKAIETFRQRLQWKSS